MSTQMERNQPPNIIPGSRDFTVSIKSVYRNFQRILDGRYTLKSKQEVPVSDYVDWEEQYRNDLVKIRSFGSSPHRVVWDVIKRTHGLLAIQRKLKLTPDKAGATVDAVIQNGTEWLKVVSVTEEKLHMQMAQEGWHMDDEFDDKGSIMILITATSMAVRSISSNSQSSSWTRLVQTAATLGHLEYALYYQIST